MKVFGGIKGGGHTQTLMDEKYHDLALRYAWSLPGCASAVVGMVDSEELDENIRRARAFTALNDEERMELLEAGKAIAKEWGEHLGVRI